MAGTERTCRHCSSTLAGAGADQDFCCTGCRSAHAVITACGLSDFYRLRDQASATANTPRADPSAERDALAATVVIRDDGLSEVRWHVTGLHCAACVWLLEQLPRLDPGIRSARISLANGRLAVVYDPARTTPTAQVRLVGSLGYGIKPYAQATSHRRDERRVMLIRLAVASASALGAMHLSLNLYAGELTRDLDVAGGRLFGIFAGAVALPGLTYGAAPLYHAAFNALRHRRLNMEVSATLVIVVGVVASVINLLHGSRELYFDAVTMFIALLLGGRMVVAAASARVANATEVLDHLMPLVARRIVADGGVEAVPTTALACGDAVMVARGEVVPCDGTLEGGSASIDAAALSGESRPVQLIAGDLVHAGTTCLSDQLRLHVSAVGAATRMGRVLSSIGDAATRPTRLVRIADRLQAGFIISVATLALITILASWLAGGPGSGSSGLGRAIALVLVSCPCALGLATPLVQAMAVSRAAARGILVRDAGALEALGRLGHRGSEVRHVVFDKTGTLTAGRLRVVAWQWLDGFGDIPQNWVRCAVASAEARSQHPLAVALGAELAGCPVHPLAAWREVPGQGLLASTERGELAIGNQRLTGVPCPPLRTWGVGDTVIAVTLAGIPLVRIACADPVRPGAAELLGRLRTAGIITHLCSGDDPRVAASVGNALGFAPERIHGGMAPEDKAGLVDQLSASGAVAVVGDGINDAAALARADVSIGLRGGVESAIGSCQVFIARDDVWEGLHELFSGASDANARVRLVLTVSLLYNAIGIALAMIGVWGPYLCAVAMPASSITAVGLAAAGRYFRPATANPIEPPPSPSPVLAAPAAAVVGMRN